jgi:hypothetical protein
MRVAVRVITLAYFQGDMQTVLIANLSDGFERRKGTHIKGIAKKW